jgi:hypothetical protein
MLFRFSYSLLEESNLLFDISSGVSHLGDLISEFAGLERSVSNLLRDISNFIRRSSCLFWSEGGSIYRTHLLKIAVPGIEIDFHRSRKGRLTPRGHKGQLRFDKES